MTNSTPSFAGSAGATMLPDSWNGQAIPLFMYPSLRIICTVAPSVPWTIQSSPNGSDWNDLLATICIPSNSVSALGDYFIPGGTYIRLNGGTGGTFFIAGGQ